MADKKDCENGKNTLPDQALLEGGQLRSVIEAQLENTELNAKSAGKYSRGITMEDNLICMYISKSQLPYSSE